MVSHRWPIGRPVDTAQTDEVVRLDSLTGLRIFAAVWVMLLHFRTVTATTTFEFPLIDRFVLQGNYGVDLFFVLSGFILSHVYFTHFRSKVGRSSYWSFISFRFARLYPVHLVTFLMMVALYVGQMVLMGRSSAEAPERYALWPVLQTLTMTHAWSGHAVTPNLPSWSISAEWFAYLLFPFLCILIARSRLMVVAFLAFGLGLAVLGEADNEIVRVMAGFLVGMATFQLSRHSLRLVRLPFLGSLIVLLIIGWAMSGAAARLEIGIVLFAALIFALSNGRDWLCRVLGRRTVVYLGEVSYALYMVHWVVRVVMRAVVEKTGVLNWAPVGAVVAAYILATVLAAIALYHVIEKPWRKRLRRWLTARPARSEGVAA
jgi:peptidoglycan/LPS O-acetylase OafA/YrhL